MRCAIARIRASFMSHVIALLAMQLFCVPIVEDLQPIFDPVCESVQFTSRSILVGSTVLVVWNGHQEVEHQLISGVV